MWCLVKTRDNCHQQLPSTPIINPYANESLIKGFSFQSDVLLCRFEGLCGVLLDTFRFKRGPDCYWQIDSIVDYFSNY